MKVYTKSGDKGKTGLIGGTRVLKSDARVNAYGSVDEVNSWVGMIISELDSEFATLKEELTQLQILLFDVGTDLASPDAKEYLVTKDNLKAMEDMIDRYDEKLQPIEKFVLPGGHLIASHFQIVRTIARRAEREATELVAAEESINFAAYKVLNRLSDLFFILARYMNQVNHVEEPFYEKAGKVFH